MVVSPSSQKHHNQTQGGPCAEECIGKADHATGDIIDATTTCQPSRRAVTYLSVTTKTLTLDGPVALTQGGPGPAFIMRHPIFVNTTGKEYNATFGRPYDVTDCPDACYNATSGMRYWGMSDSLLRFHRCERANALRHVRCICRAAISQSSRPSVGSSTRQHSTSTWAAASAQSGGVLCAT